MIKKWTYYNDNDEYVCEWTRNLIKAGHIPDGYVDCRPIQQISDVTFGNFAQCHFFCGISGWAYALRLAGWPDDLEMWTASCPCQPFSQAGLRKGKEDARHLWPVLYKLIAANYPARILGEQVASADGRVWLAGVRADLEALAYGVGCADLCAAGVGAPHIRQRLWWVADSERDAGESRRAASECGESNGTPHAGACVEPGRRSMSSSGMAYGIGAGREIERSVGGVSRAPDAGNARQDAERSSGLEHAAREQTWIPGRARIARRAGNKRMAKSDGGHACDGELQRSGEQRLVAENGSAGYWDAYDLIPCIDGKSRRIEPGTFPLAFGVLNRMGKLRAYGNAICPQVAAEFIRAYIDIITD